MKTIKSKVIVLLIVCLVFIGVLHVLYYHYIFSLQGKIKLIQKFDDFRDHVLEMRRYEKNFIYFKDIESLNENIYYFFKIEDFSHELSKDVIRVVGTDTFSEFQDDLKDYKTVLDENMRGVKIGQGKLDVETIRTKGKKIVDFAKELIMTKRQRIQKAIHRIMIIPMVFLVSFIVFVALILNLISKGILKPVALMQKATEEAAKGTFKPIVYESGREDEVTHLIETFNEMAKQLETKQEQLLQSRKMASIGTFTSGIAHELNNPLNNISLTAESLMEEFTEITKKEASEMMMEILAQADRASQVVKNLLEFSRTERPLLLELSIEDILDRTIKLIKNQIMITGIQLRIVNSENLPPIKGRSQDLQQAFINIILNSIQAMKDLSGENIISIRTGPGPDGYIRSDFSDTGIGIKPEDMKNIFDPFYTTKPVGRGTGLGLSLVYGIIRTHGGYIEVKSEINKGTTFSIYLPIAANEGKETGYAA
ncbi:MAG: HAMP domain-containing histidine kinase [Deltaproteobacteria bacterium]|nr:HAMP domain-containing histidine kinase [Deltaproteobacteria bacterium]